MDKYFYTARKSTRRSATATLTAQLLRVKSVTRILRIGAFGGLAFRLKFYRNRAIPCQNVDTIC